MGLRRYLLDDLLPAHILSMSNPKRTTSGVPTGGQFARNGQAESAVSLDDVGSPPPAGPTGPRVARFETSGAHPAFSSTGSLNIDRVYMTDRSDATAHLRRFSAGDTVVITDAEGHEYEAQVTSEDLINDDLGWPVSRTLTASAAASDHSFAVNAHTLVTGRIGIRAASHPQSVSRIEPPDSPAESRFATNGSQRAAAVPQYKEGAQPYQAELRQAMTYLAGFKTGDTVVVTGEQGQEHFAKITSDRRSDGEYGSPESRTMRASLGTNKYSYDVDSHQLAMGKVGMRHARPEEQEAADTQFAQADAAWAVTKQQRVDEANIRLAAANLPSVGEPAVAWERTTSELRGTVLDITERGDYVSLVISGRPGPSLVPADSVSARTLPAD